LLLLLWTTVRPIQKTYRPNKIIPFPLNEECINNMESAMNMKTSSRFFYDYLFAEQEDEKALSLFALYSDLRHYFVLVDDHAPKD